MLRGRARDPDPLVCVVTTVKDTLENIDRFVDRNLAAGADHVFVFLDDADPEKHAHLGGNRHVTAVRTGSRYWHGNRPRSLNWRQWTNANLVNLALAALPEVGWLFHLDGDECLDLDRDRLLTLPPEVRAVRLRPLESVVASSAGAPLDLFKRPLHAGELALLTTLGAIRRPHNGAYFHGHTSGKSGLRPSLDLRLGVHDVKTTDRTPVEPYEAPWLNLLHRQSSSVEEFVRKWAAHLGPENQARFRSHKEQLRAALATLMELDIDETHRDQLVREIYRLHVADDVELLDKLGFLVRPHEEWHEHKPRRLPKRAQQDLELLLGQLRALDKEQWFHRRTYRARDLVSTLLEEAESPSVRERLRAALGTARADDDGARTGARTG